MSHHRPLRWLAPLAAAVLTLAPSLTTAEELPYTLSVVSDVELKAPSQPKPQSLNATTLLHYTLEKKGDTVEITISGLQVKVESDKNLLMESRMNQKEAMFLQGNQSRQSIPYAKAPANLKQMLDMFGKPAAEIQVDSNGAETGRNVLVDASSPFVESGIIDNTRIFHPPFPADKDQWEAPVRFSIGGGQFAQGTLKYQKDGEGPGGTTKVKISGELKAEGKTGVGEIKNGTYKVEGSELYDPSKSAWVSGQIKANMALDVLSEGQPAGSVQGAMTLTLDEGTIKPAAEKPAQAEEAARPAPEPSKD